MGKRDALPDHWKHTEYGPPAFPLFRDAGVALVFASADDREMAVLKELADERRKKRYPGPAYRRHIAPTRERLEGDLSVFNPELPCLDFDDHGQTLDAAMPAGPPASRDLLAQFAAGGFDGASWKSLRDVLLLALRMELWECNALFDDIIDAEHLQAARDNIIEFLEMILAYHNDDRQLTAHARKRYRQALHIEMSKWVADTGSLYSPQTKFTGFSPVTGEFSVASVLAADFWTILVRSLSRLLPTFGTAGLGRCPRCGWFFHPALWLHARKSGVVYCSDWCKREYHNPRRSKKRRAS
jgi:hypothetical protein